MSKPKTYPTAIHIGWLIILLLVAGLLYWPGANGPYLFDDKPNLVFNKHLHLDELSLKGVVDAAQSSQESGSGRPISFATFAFNYGLAGHVGPAPIKVTNILLHLIIGVLVFALSQRLVTRLSLPVAATWYWPVSLFLAGFWLLHPLWASTVLYAVQRMAMLSTLFILIGVYAYFHLRTLMVESARGFKRMLLFIPLLTACAFFSKENGALLPLFCLVVEVFCFRFYFHPAIPQWQRLGIKLGLLAGAASLATVLLYYGLRDGDALLAFREFTIAERLLTQLRVLWYYVSWVWLLQPDGFHFFHDTIPLSKGLFSPASTVFALMGWALAFAFIIWSAKTGKALWLGFALAWFLVGHLLESTSIPLELAFEHRNYLPAVGLVLAIAILLVKGLTYLPLRREVSIFVLFAALAFPATLLYERVYYWQDEVRLVDHWIINNPDSPRALAKYADFATARQAYDDAEQGLVLGAKLAPYEAGYLLARMTIHCFRELPIEEAWVTSAVARLNRLPNTAYTKAQLSQLTRHCGEEPYLDEVAAIMAAAANLHQDEMAGFALYTLGLIHLIRHEYEPAQQYLKKTLLRDPSIVPAREYLSRLESGEYQRTINQLQPPAQAEEAPSAEKAPGL